ncbi:MAG TPA: fatty acid desaturase [Gemmatimonadaceae bacterium]|nr:fatty acid desaturase [Gemmatimonadaceae bacterium]
MAEGTNPRAWRAAVAPYVGPDVRRSLYQTVTTGGLFALALVVIHRALAHPSPWATLLGLVVMLPAAGLLVRIFIIMHDCAHGSFLPSRRAMDVLGWVTGVLTFTPYGQWRRDHALHHASSGDLDHRGHGDVPTLTVREYLARTPGQRRQYRFLRHPLTLLLLGPLHLLLGQRWRSRGTATGDRQIASVMSTNAGIVVLVVLATVLWGWRAVVLVYLPVYYLAAMAGVWLFYVQHQFEDAYWENEEHWDYATAAIRGSSHLRLPAVLQWFTGNIGLHHVHHLAPRIPNYRLQRCHDASPLLQEAPVVTIRSGMAAMRLALWDEERRRLVSFAEVQEPVEEETPSLGPSHLAPG